MKPFPWPSVKFDPAAIAAAAAFNLLLVFAFLTPTRGAVATIVREKELRLREGMRILGLKVSDESALAPCVPTCSSAWVSGAQVPWLLCLNNRLHAFTCKLGIKVGVQCHTQEM